MWLLSRLRARVPDVDVHVRQMAHSPVYGFYLTSSFEVIYIRNCVEIRPHQDTQLQQQQQQQQQLY